MLPSSMLPPIPRDARGQLKVYCRQASIANYRQNRENGDVVDSPKRPFPADGICRWSQNWGKPNPRYEYRVRYDEGVEDNAWMKEKDQNYLDRQHAEKGTTQIEKITVASSDETFDNNHDAPSNKPNLI